MKIRKITETKLPDFYKTFAEVLKEGFPEYSSKLIDFFLNKDFPLSTFREKLNDRTYQILVADNNRKIVGFLVIEKLYGGVSYCPWLGVLREARGSGVGRALIWEWEKEIKKIGGHKLMLLTQSRINREIFSRYGFKEEGNEEKSWFGLDCWMFGKIIGEPKEIIFLK